VGAAETDRAAATPAARTGANGTGAATTAAARRNGKSAAAFWTTGEVADALDLPAHVLRFWESRFAQIKPLKRAGGRRYYRPQDVDLLRRIRQCLYQEGYTIRGVQKLLRDGALRPDQPPPAEEINEATGAISIAHELGAELAGNPALSRQALREALEAVQRDLLEIRALLDKLVLP
jgi:DNA-binding transcriptional MerR regulator